MFPRVLLVSSLLIAAVVGCGGPQPVERRPPSGPAIYNLIVKHESRMSESFELAAITVRLNDRVVYDQTASDGAVIETPKCVLHQRVPAGDHELTVELLYRGHGYGIFSYLNEYRFRVRSARFVSVPTNAFGVHVTSTGHESGGATTPLEDRPSISWSETIERSDPNATCEPSDSPAPAESAASPDQ